MNSVSKPQPIDGWNTPIFWFCGCRGRNERVTYADDADKDRQRIARLEAAILASYNAMLSTAYGKAQVILESQVCEIDFVPNRGGVK